MEQLIVMTGPELRNIIRQELVNYFSQNNTPQSVISERYLNIKEAVGLLKLSKTTVYSLAAKGELPSIKRGKRVLFSEIKLKEWMDKGTVKSPHELLTEGQSNMIKNHNKRVTA